MPRCHAMARRRQRVARERRHEARAEAPGAYRWEVMINARHPIRGLLIGPPVAPVGYWLGSLALAWADGRRPGWSQAGRELAVVAAFGLPIAYGATVLWGLPILYALRCLGRLSAWTVILTGAIGGALVSIWFACEQQAAFIQVRLSMPGAVVLGGLAGGACWWLGLGRSKPAGPAAVGR